MNSLGAHTTTKPYRVGAEWPRLELFPRQIGIRLEARNAMGQKVIQGMNKYPNINKWISSLHEELQGCLKDGSIQAVATPDQFKEYAEMADDLHEYNQDVPEIREPSPSRGWSAGTLKRIHTKMEKGHEAEVSGESFGPGDDRILSIYRIHPKLARSPNLLESRQWQSL